MGPLQQFVVRTHKGVLNPLYVAIYYCCGVLTMLVLKAACPAATVVLRRGLSEGEILAGLSDIDLSAVIPDSGHSPARRARLEAAYRAMSAWLPMLGDVAQEFAVYQRSELTWLETFDAHYRYRGRQGRVGWWVLGRPLPPVPEPNSHQDLASCALEELKVWWFCVRKACCGNASGVARNYAIYKALTEAMRVSTTTSTGRIPVSRTRVLARWIEQAAGAGDDLGNEPGGVLKRANRSTRLVDKVSCFSDLDDQDALSLFFGINDQSVQSALELGRDLEAGYFLDWDQELVREQAQIHHDDLSGVLELPAVIIPESCFRISPRDVTWVSARALVVQVEDGEPIPLQKLVAASRDMPYRLYLATENMAYRVRSATAGFCTRSRVNDPCFFALIDAARRGALAALGRIPMRMLPRELDLVCRSRRKVIDDNDFHKGNDPADQQLAEGWLRAVSDLQPGGTLPLSHSAMKSHAN